MRYCYKCQSDLKDDCFYYGDDDLFGDIWCIECRKLYAADYRENNHAEYLSKQESWREEVKSGERTPRRKNLMMMTRSLVLQNEGLSTKEAVQQACDEYGVEMKPSYSEHSPGVMANFRAAIKSELLANNPEVTEMLAKADMLESDGVED